jgi:hypothetical protein
MTGEELRTLIMTTFSHEKLFELARRYGLIERQRRFDLVRFIISLVFTGGTEECGRQCAVLRDYLSSGAPQVVRGAFYAWFTEPLEMLLTEMLNVALEAASCTPKLLPGVLGTVSDWRVVDCTTVLLRHALIDEWRGSGNYAAVKVHKEWSVGYGNLVKYRLSPAREGDNKHFEVDSSRTGTGLIVDLGYASHDLLRDCETYGVSYVIRLKCGWKLRVKHLHAGKLNDRLGIDSDMEIRLSRDTPVSDGGLLDADVEIGEPGKPYIRCRLLCVPTAKGYCVYLSNLSRDTHTAIEVGDIYRVRWEIEIDNKVDKTGAQLDRVSAEKPVSVRILILASLLNATLARIVVQRRKLELYATRRTDPTTGQQEVTGPPLHPIKTVQAMRAFIRQVEKELLPETPQEVSIPMVSDGIQQQQDMVGKTPQEVSIPTANQDTCEPQVALVAQVTKTAVGLYRGRTYNRVSLQKKPVSNRVYLPPARTNPDWDRLVDILISLGKDDNWRRCPSVLDRLQGLVGTPARKRKSTIQVP